MSAGKHFRTISSQTLHILVRCSFASNIIINPVNDEINPICHLLALLGTHHILHVSRIRVNTASENTVQILIDNILQMKVPMVLISPYPEQEGNMLGSMPGTRAISTTSRREMSSSFLFPARQGAEGNSRHSDRHIRFFPSWSDLKEALYTDSACRSWQLKLSV